MNANKRGYAAEAFVPAALLSMAGLVSAVRAAETGFAIQEKPGACVDVLLDGKTAARYVCAYDTSTPERLHETYKPYLHLFDAEGKTPITKGAGGSYTHHRGIFIGWNKIGFGGKTHDRWHMKGGEQVHQKLLAQKAGADEASFTSLVHWNDPDGRPMIVEERAMSFRRAPAPGRLLVDFASTLSAPAGPVQLDGDPEHAGIHYRPANEIAADETVYVYPKEGANAHKDVDYPWVGESYTVGGKRYSVIQMNHPGNPKGTRFSAYRNYGRFGAFPKAEIPAGGSLTVKYRFLIADGEMPSAEAIQACWDGFAGVSAPSPVPKTTVLPAEGAKKK